MNRLAKSALLLVIFVAVDASFINPYARFWKRFRGLSRVDGDNGDPLFLTPYLEAGKVKEGREAARVNHSRIVGFESYTGFFTVDKTYNSNLSAIGYTIHKKNPTAKVPINLQGLAIGNGYSDPLNQIDYGDYLFQLGLIDANAKDRFDRDEAKAVECVQKNDYDCAFKIMDDLMDGDTDGTSFFKNISGFDTYYNYLHTSEDPTDEFYLAAFLKLPETRKALHVGDLPFHDLEQDNKVEKYLQHDILDSVAPWIVELLANYRMLIYNGQLDIICAYPMMVNYLKNLPFNGAAEYRTADRYIFYVDGEIAGYFKLVNNLLEVLIRDAGHMVPRDQPKWAYVMINTFTTVRSFD